MKQGDLVVRKSYGGDLLFRIEKLEQRWALLKGTDFRLMADSPVNDLQPFQETRPHPEWSTSELKWKQALQGLEQFMWKQKEKVYLQHGSNSSSLPYFDVPGKILHLDGDPAYLRKSMILYGELRIPAEGFYVAEANMAQALFRLLPQVQPDVLVITGHDGILKHRKMDPASLESYKNSLSFVNAVKVARQYERNRDTLTIVAGACQSHFEALLQAGSNFASSPARVLIHALDPVTVAIKSAYTSIQETVDIYDVISGTMSGAEGLGGIETRGSYRMGLPKIG
jgi:spore coat assemly protein